MTTIGEEKYYSIQEIPDTSGFKVGWTGREPEELLSFIRTIGRAAYASGPEGHPGSAFFDLGIGKGLRVLVINTAPDARRTFQYVKVHIGHRTLKNSLRNMETRTYVVGLFKRSVSGLLKERTEVKVPVHVELTITPFSPPVRPA